MNYLGGKKGWGDDNDGEIFFFLLVGIRLFFVRWDEMVWNGGDEGGVSSIVRKE